MRINVSAFAALCAVLMAASVIATQPARADDQPVPVIFSTDTASGLQGGLFNSVIDIDDGLAIALAIASPKLEVLGVIVTFGNTSMEPEYYIAKKVVDAMSSTVPVLHGAPRPLPEYTVELFDGTVLNDACLNEGVSFIAEQLMASDRQVTILAIGPLTDIACLALNYPEAHGKIERVVIIGGRDPGKTILINGHYNSDFNLASDFPAVRYLLEETDIRLRFLPFELTYSVLVPPAKNHIVCESELALAADFFCPVVDNWINAWRDMFGESGFHPWDQNAVFVTMEPDAYQCKPAQYDIVDCAKASCAGHDAAHPERSDFERGQLWISPGSKNDRVEVCRNYSVDGKDKFEASIYSFAQ